MGNSKGVISTSTVFVLLFSLPEKFCTAGLMFEKVLLSYSMMSVVKNVNS